MRYPNARPALLAGLALTATASLAEAQSPPFNSQLVGQLNQGSSVYADIWADGNIAYLARFGQSQVDIVSLANPTSPNLLATYSMSSPDNGSSAQDVKSSGDGLLFIASESGGSNGVHIVDVRTPSSPVLLTTIDPEPGSFEFIHNMSYDDGWLYICNSSDTEIAVIDLRFYNPNSPPASISSWDYLIDVPGALFIHDITVENGRLYASGWDNLTIWDVSNLASSAPSLLGTIGGMSNHAVWPSSDGAYCVTTDEREGGALRLYELIDNGSSITIQARDSYQSPLGQSFSAHNPVMIGDRVYASWYQTGGLVFQIDRTNHTLQLVASYDTSTAGTGGFAGNWGSYPLGGEEAVLLSDIENGMYLVDFSAVQIAYVNAREELIEVGVPQSVTVEISDLGNVSANTGTVSLMASVNGAAFQSIPMTFIGGGQYTGDLPKMNCNSSVNYYVQVNDFSAGTWTNPATAPSETYVAYSRGASTLPIFADTFQSDLGWTTSNTSVSAGAWERGNPTETGGQAERGDYEEAGARCFVTGLSATSIGSNDLDGGPTVLFSPILDFSAGDGLISYSRWFFNDDGDGDTLEVAVSNNAGGSWTVVETVDDQNGGGWIKQSFRVSDHVSPTSQVQMRFTASDEPNSSITEAGVDAFSAVGFNCLSAAVAQVRTGIGVNPNIFSSTSLPIIGMDWNSEIDASGISGASLTYILGFQFAFDPGLMLNFGELLIDITSEPLITNPLAPAGGGVASHLISVPNDCGLQGLQIFNQGVVFSPGLVTLTNAIDIVLEY